MLVKINNNMVEKYPFTLSELRQENANVSFPSLLTDELLSQYGVYETVTADTPQYNELLEKAILRSNPELVNGVWTVQWDIVAKTAEEIEVERINAIPKSITALQGLLAIDAAGLSSAYDAWAIDDNRTFKEKAFINRADIWKRDDATLLSAAAMFGLTDLQVDGLFILGVTL